MNAVSNEYQTIFNWMWQELLDDGSMYVDPLTGEVNCTALAENAIVDGIADDSAWVNETHPVWDAAVDAADRYPRIRRY